MTASYASQELDLRLWRQLYQTYTLLKQCEDRIYEEHGLTTEQYAVLVSISYLGQPARITDIARWLERSTNSISMIVDRMVKAGLVKRARDKGDRRVVYVSKTSKAESLFKPASVAGFESVRRILSPIPHTDKVTLLDLLGEVKYETMKCLDPAVDIAAVKKDELRRSKDIKDWARKYGSSSACKARSEGGQKRRSVRNHPMTA